MARKYFTTEQIISKLREAAARGLGSLEAVVPRPAARGHPRGRRRRHPAPRRAPRITDTLRPRLALFQGDRILAVREVPPDHEWVLGRRPDSPLPLNERSISRQHVRVYCDSAGTHLEDLGTPNGTWLDGAPVRGTVVLRDGQVMRLGQSTNPDPLLLRFEDPASRLLDTLARAGTDGSPSALPDAAIS